MFLILQLVLSLEPSVKAQTVRVITLDATINPATAEYIHESIQKSASNGDECLVIRLNTPGGLLKSTRVIVTDFLTAPLPVIVYVSPSGAQSASAGAFITLAAHIAAMAPGTNIGAAHPVGMQGGEKDSIMNEKATNDAAAFIRTISEKRHRNVRWAEDAVRKSISITETEALSDSVIDLIAPSVPALLAASTASTVNVNGTDRTLHTRTAAVIDEAMGWKFKILDILSDPNIAYIFFMLGLYGLLFELYNPGAIFPGVVGVIASSWRSIPCIPSRSTTPALALIVFGIVLFVLELKITSHGTPDGRGTSPRSFSARSCSSIGISLEFVSISWSVIIAAVVCHRPVLPLRHRHRHPRPAPEAGHRRRRNRRAKRAKR